MVASFISLVSQLNGLELDIKAVACQYITFPAHIIIILLCKLGIIIIIGYMKKRLLGRHEGRGTL